MTTGAGRDEVDLARRPVHPALQGLVAGVVGLSERTPGVVRRRQPAGPLVPLVFSFGEPLWVDALADATGAGQPYGSFVAGLSGGPAETHFVRGQDTVQVYLTPVGVGQVLGTPGVELAHRVVGAGDVAVDLGSRLAERLHSRSTWEQRFDLVERLLIKRVSGAPVPPAWVPWMWEQIRLSGGRVRIGELVTTTGFSHRHVTTTFLRQVGLTPKTLARLVRFDQAMADLTRLPLAEVAALHGYVDQSHLARETTCFAGETPAQLRDARRPTPTLALGADR